MEYRQLCRTGLDVGVIGLGIEHLEQTKETMDHVLGTAVDAGVNYVDFVYPELDYWEALGSVIRSHRSNLILACHWGSGPRFDLDFCQRTFDNILSCVGNDFVEVAIMTMATDESRPEQWIQESLERLRRYQEWGQVGWIGASGHEPAGAMGLVGRGLLDVLMFGVNMIEAREEDKRAVYEACARQGVGLVAMKPYFGGTLLYVDGEATSITPAQCLAYVLSLPVSTTVPGPKNVEELRATLHYLAATDQERDYDSAIANMHHDLAGHCVYCNHCLPCPQSIDIGQTILRVDFAQAGVTDELSAWYDILEVRASECNECGVCMERCPFDVDVIAKMRRAVELFEIPAG